MANGLQDFLGVPGPFGVQEDTDVRTKWNTDDSMLNPSAAKYPIENLHQRDYSVFASKRPAVDVLDAPTNPYAQLDPLIPEKYLLIHRLMKTLKKGY